MQKEGDDDMKGHTSTWQLPFGWVEMNLQIHSPEGKLTVEQIDCAIEAMMLTRRSLCKYNAARDAFVPTLPLLTP